MTARMHAFMPGASPPDVSTAIFFTEYKIRHYFVAIINKKPRECGVFAIVFLLVGINRRFSCNQIQHNHCGCQSQANPGFWLL